MKNRILLVLFAAAFVNAHAADPGVISRLSSDVEYLCNDDLKGRDAPGADADRVADWLVESFTLMGASPGAGVDTFLQRVDLITASLDRENTTLARYKNGLEMIDHWGDGFYVFPKAIADGNISAPAVNWREIGEFNGKAMIKQWDAGMAGHAGAYAVAKLSADVERSGAAMLVVVAPDSVWEEGFPDPDKIAGYDRRLVDLPGSQLDFPLIYASRRCIPEAPDSISLTLQFKGHLSESAFNVIARVEGTLPEYVVVGAHYDHLGEVISGAGRPDLPQAGFYPGADDNASGVAGLLELARRCVASQPLQGAGVLFVAFTCEEDGLLGSKWFVGHLPLPREQIRAMVNMDMIGRDAFASFRDVYNPANQPDSLFAAAYYSAGSPKLRDIIHSAADRSELRVQIQPANAFNRFGDAGPFHDAQIPTLHIFSGFHADYHSVTDTPDKLNYGKLARMVDFTGGVIRNLREEPSRIEFEQKQPPRHKDTKD